MDTNSHAGDLRARLSDETIVKPTPMVQIGRHPILRHFLNSFVHLGSSEFIQAPGSKGTI